MMSMTPQEGRKSVQEPTPCAPSGGNPPAFGKDPSNGLLAGEGARAPFGCPHEWSTKSVFISGFGRGFLQSWCCQFRLQLKEKGKQFFVTY